MSGIPIEAPTMPGRAATFATWATWKGDEAKTQARAREDDQEEEGLDNEEVNNCPLQKE